MTNCPVIDGKCGTTGKFVPVLGIEAIQKGDTEQVFQTRYQCITAMKLYEKQSLEVGL